MTAIVQYQTQEIKLIARQLGLAPEIVELCVEAELVQPALAEADLAELRRLRRLQHDLEVNVAGAEIILRMRQRILAMQAEMEAMAAEMAAIRVRFERELRDRERSLASDSA